MAFFVTAALVLSGGSLSRQSKTLLPDLKTAVLKSRRMKTRANRTMQENHIKRNDNSYNEP